MSNYQLGQIVGSAFTLTCGKCGTEREHLEYFGLGDWRCVGGCDYRPRDFPTLNEKLEATNANIVNANYARIAGRYGKSVQRSTSPILQEQRIAEPATTADLYRLVQDVLVGLFKDSK